MEIKNLFLGRFKVWFSIFTYKLKLKLELKFLDSCKIMRCDFQLGSLGIREIHE